MEESSKAPIQFHNDNPIVQQILGGVAPQNIKLAAAKGALPLTRDELLHVLYFLKDDSDGTICMAVVQTIDQLSDDELSVLLSSQNLAPEILNFYARMAIDKEKTATTLLTNPAVTDEAVEFLSRRVSTTALELIVTNQVRLIRHPKIIRSALSNPSISADQIRRLHEVWEEFFVKKKAEDERIRRETAEAKVKPEEKPAAKPVTAVPPVVAHPTAAPAAAAAPKAAAEALLKEDEEESLTTYQRMLKLSVPEKIQLALKGTKEERTLLLRDPSRVVFMSVVKSPKLSDGEVELIASMRNVPEEVLRSIGSNREWMKKYSVMVQLIKNPKAPIGITMNFINRLNPKDLKQLSVDKGVPEILRRTAKQMLDAAMTRKK